MAPPTPHPPLNAAHMACSCILVHHSIHVQAVSPLLSHKLSERWCKATV